MKIKYFFIGIGAILVESIMLIAFIYTLFYFRGIVP